MNLPRRYTVCILVLLVFCSVIYLIWRRSTGSSSSKGVVYDDSIKKFPSIFPTSSTSSLISAEFLGVIFNEELSAASAG